MSALRLLLACLASCLAGAVGASGVALAGVSPATNGTGAPSFGNPLVVPGMQPLIGGQQTQAAEEALRESPRAFMAREASRTAFEGMSPGAAAKLVREAFPGMVDQPAGALPALPSGQRIVAYPTDHAAQVDLPGGKHGVIQSMEPIAIETSPGRHEPLNLSLTDTGGVFQPLRSDVGLHIPMRLSEGVRLPDTGVSLIPVDARGSALSGSQGALDGATVVYSNTQVDSDTVVKPLTSGFEEDTLLRSVNSPSQLAFRIGLPAGASLVSAKDGSGTVNVVKEGVVIAAVPAPSAHDAEGVAVPVSMKVSGDTLALAIAQHAGSYQYPIVVDPEVVDTTLEGSVGKPSNWEHEGTLNTHQYMNKGTLEDTSTSAGTGDYGLWNYGTLGESYIYKFISETSSSGTHLENQLAIVKPPGTIEKSANLPASYSTTRTEVCGQPSCATGKVESGNKENVAYFQQVSTPHEGGESFTTVMSAASIYVLQEKAPTTNFNTTVQTYGSLNTTNVLYANTWLGPNNKSGFFASSTDPGIGINKVTVTSSPAAPNWEYSESEGCIECGTITGALANPTFSYSNWRTYATLPDGEDTIEVKMSNATGLTASAQAKVKVDGTPPHEIGLPGLPPNKEIGNGLYHVKATAKDGSGSVPSSGVESLVLKVDGRQVGSPSGSCSPGPCVATGEWVISGTEFAIGQHEVTVTATDNAKNVATEKFTMYVARPASPLGVGPGGVDPETGNLHLSATDASVGAGNATLSVARDYGSLHTTDGSEGPLGPQWTLQMGSSQNVVKLPDGDMLLTNGSGLQAVFASEGAGKFAAPKGDTGLTLTEKTVEGKVQFQLVDKAGNITTFTPTTSGTMWLATVRENANSLNKTKTTYQIVGSIVEPTQVLGPVPAGVTCTSELVKGCRALGFVYATKTTATGDSQSEWGEFNGRLKEVTFTAWSTSAGKMTTTAVAQYEYDKEGKLRAEWDPQISPALKTTYGYDAEGRLTAMTSPGQQPWLFTYGTVAGDTRNGRLLAVTRPSATTAAGNGIAPKNTAAPAISGTVEVGKTVSVSNGTWSNSPLSYEYEWDSCNSSGAECVAITGATNQTFFVPISAAGHKLVAKVTATNSDGSGTASTAATIEVKNPPWYFLPFGSAGSGLGQLNAPAGVATDSKGYVWVVDSGNNRLEEFEYTGEFPHTFGSSGTGANQFSKPTGIAIDPKTSNIYVSDTGNNRIDEFDSTGKFIETFGWGVADGKAEAEKCATNCHAGIAGSGVCQLKEPTGIVIAEGKIRVSDTGNNRLSIDLTGNMTLCLPVGSAGSGNGQFSKPKGIAVRTGSPEYTDVADSGNNRIETWEVNPWKYASTFGSLGSGNGELSSPVGILDNQSEGLIRVVDSANNRVETFSTSGTYKEQFGVAGTGGFGQFKTPEWVAEEEHGTQRFLYITDTKNNRVMIASKQSLPEPPQAPPTPPSLGTSAVTTIEYHVPVSGSGAPYAMGRAEVKTWGQSEGPSEATAIFPPDELEGWPAQDYKRATIYYVDSKGRSVNVATPSGGISTTEYNEANDVVRSLTPDNRAIVLKRTWEAKLLDTQSTYSSDGTELLSTLGPQHLVKLANGKEVQARSHTVYSYNEGAPTEGGPYALVTKQTQGAQIEGEAEQDIRTTTTSYSGQSNLGWTLRKPTSATVDPGGLNLTTTTLYDPTTGNVTETRSPAGSSGSGGESSAPPTYASQFGSLGSGNGQLHNPRGLALDASGELLVADEENNRVDVFNEKGEYAKTIGSLGSGNGQMKEPRGVAIDSKGNIWVTDTANFRLEEFNEKAEFVRVAGWGVSNGESKFQICTTGCRAGLVGAGAGQFAQAKGIAVDSHNNVFVADTGNNRVQELNEKGEYLKTFGSYGTGNGQLKEPRALTVASNGSVWVADSTNNRVEVFKENGEYEKTFGSLGTGNGQFKEPKGIAIDSHKNVWVSDAENNRVQRFNEKGEYQFQFGTAGTGNGQFKEPWGILLDTHGNVIVSDGANNRIQKWTVFASNPEAHDTQMIYYSAAANSKYPGCGEHAEWANLPCETKPAAQPGTSGLPELPVTIYKKYNVWFEPETVEQSVGASTRTTSATYDAAGRALTSSVSSTVGTSLPTVTNEYNTESGALVKQSTTVEGKTQSLTGVFNKLGQLTSYTDADGNVSTFEYEPEKDTRLTKVNDGKGTQTYTYDETTGAVKELADSAAGKFTASYDVEGRLTSEGYPNGMNANYAYNQNGEATGLEYIKTTHCTSACTWYNDSLVPSIHGQSLSQASSLASQSYTYDSAGRLTQVQETPAGKGCITRLYTYDEETNRTSLTVREPGAEGKCATEGGTTEAHTYDTADRLVEAGVSYDAFGNTTALPAQEAGGSELTSGFYVNNRLASQTQAGETIGSQLDPAGRVRETVSTGKVVASVINHYAGGGAMPTWTSEVSGQWTRNIQGIAGGLAAIQKNGETPVLQLADLKGNIVATAALSETETKLLGTTRSTEYGVPTTEAPPKYSWLGAYELPTELPSGVVAMGVRSYVPQIGRFLQTDPIPGGSANAYAYVFGDPVNTSDPSGASAAWFKEFARKNATEIVVAAAAREQAAREEAANKVLQAQESAGSSQGGEEAFVLGGSAGWACEYAEETGQEGCENAGENLEQIMGVATAESGSRSKGGGNGGGQSKGTSGGQSCRSGGRMVNGQCQQGNEGGSGGVQRILLRCIIGAGVTTTKRPTPASAGVGCLASFIPTP